MNTFPIVSILFLILTKIRSDKDYRKGPPLWTWDCDNGHCIPSRATDPSKAQSLPTCNMLCKSMSLWPQPTGPVSLSETGVPVRADLFQLEVIASPSNIVHEHLQAAFKLFRDDVARMQQGAAGILEWRAVSVQIIVNGSADPRMRLDTDESYSLLMHPKFDAGGPLIVKISANSFCGARHALESLHQLVWYDPYTDSLHMLEAAKIEDAPRFNYRGLLLDTSGDFFSVNDIIDTIDAMAISKLNTFHWHVTDSYSFPLKFSSVPQLAIYGAFGAGATYTTDDVRKIVARARLRGIRVLIEVDTPAHVGRAWSWGPSVNLDSLEMCAEPDDWFLYCDEPPCGQLNPRNPHVYNILEAIYAEIIDLTGVDDIFHLGGNDISEKCWSSHFDDVDFNQLLLRYTQTILERLDNANGKIPNMTLFWSSQITDIIKNFLSEYVETVGFQTRSSSSDAAYNENMRGFRIVFSDADPWNLNSGFGNWFEETSGAPYNSWQRIYEHRPWMQGGGVQNTIGGEVTVWSPMLTVGGLDSRIWPRAAAFAERVWSDKPEGATRAVHVRLDLHRMRLLERGIHAAPLWSNWCTQHTYTCG